MKYFGKKLKKYIDKSGYTVYSISYQSKVNRTTLQKAISGDRQLSPENLEKIVPFLRLTPYERKDFDKAYLISFLGKETYEKHMLLKDITTKTGNWHVKPCPVFALNKSSLNIKDATSIEGSYNIITSVIKLVNNCIKKYDKPYLYTVSNFYQNFFPTLYTQLSENYYEKLEIIHTIPLVKNTMLSNETVLHNINELSSLLPFVLSIKCKVNFFYYYELNDISVFSSFPYATYLLTNENAVLFSFDFQHAIILPSDCTAYFAESFANIKLNSSLLLHLSGEYCYPFFKNDNIEHAQLSPIYDMQPNHLRFITQGMFLNIMFSGILASAKQKELTEYTERRKKMYADLNFCNAYISYDGFMDFVENGFSHELASEIRRPFTIRERIHVLKYMLKTNQHEKKHSLLLKEDSFSPQMNVITFDYTSVLFYHSDDNGTYHICKIYESGIVTEIIDFIDNLEKHAFTYSLEETNHIISASIEKLQQEL